MGMTIDDCINYFESTIDELAKEGQYCDVFEMVVDTMRKYQKFQDQSLSLYMERLKADMVAMLKELQLEIEEQSLTHSEDNILSEWGLGYNHSIERCGEIIQQKINALRAETEDT